MPFTWTLSSLLLFQVSTMLGDSREHRKEDPQEDEDEEEEEEGEK